MYDVAKVIELEVQFGALVALVRLWVQFPVVTLLPESAWDSEFATWRDDGGYHASDYLRSQISCLEEY